MNRSVSTESQATGTTVFGLMSSLLDALDKPLLVTDRSGRILFANLHAQDSLGCKPTEEGTQPNLFRDILHVDAKGLFGQLERGEQEVDLQVESTGGRARARIRWLPEPDWLVIFAARLLWKRRSIRIR